jgi:hypothetical protein
MKKKESESFSFLQLNTVSQFNLLEFRWNTFPGIIISEWIVQSWPFGVLSDLKEHRWMNLVNGVKEWSSWSRTNNRKLRLWIIDFLFQADKDLTLSMLTNSKGKWLNFWRVILISPKKKERNSVDGKVVEQVSGRSVSSFLKESPFMMTAFRARRLLQQQVRRDTRQVLPFLLQDFTGFLRRYSYLTQARLEHNKRRINSSLGKAMSYDRE